MTNGLVLVLVGVLFAFSGARAESTKIDGERPLVTFHLNALPIQGTSPVIYAHLETEFDRQLAALEFTLDGLRVEGIKSGDSLWTLTFLPFKEIGDHLLQANLYLRDKKEAERIQAGIAALDMEIVSLHQQIAAEQDATKRAALEAKLASREAYREKLEESFENLKVFLKNEIFVFSVAANPAGNFPLITSVSPNLGPLAGGTVVKILGERLTGTSAETPVVKIGGLNASVVSSSPTEIQAVAPTFAASGIRDVEVKLPGAGSNGILKNAYFTTNESQLGNIRPVAGTSGYLKANWPNPGSVQLDGSSSYDNNNDTLTYEWLVLASPKNSSLAPGSQLPPVVQPAFTPSKKGTYVFQLKVREVGTAESLVSLPVVSTIEVE